MPFFSTMETASLFQESTRLGLFSGWVPTTGRQADGWLTCTSITNFTFYFPLLLLNLLLIHNHWIPKRNVNMKREVQIIRCPSCGFFVWIKEKSTSCCFVFGRNHEVHEGQHITDSCFFQGPRMAMNLLYSTSINENWFSLFVTPASLVIDLGINLKSLCKVRKKSTRKCPSYLVIWRSHQTLITQETVKELSYREWYRK
jgi:hypothetical protein